jgi:hypothetical protein
MSRTRVLPVVLLVLAFAAAACSSGSASGSGSGSNQSSGSSPSPHAAADLAVAQQAVLRSSDLTGYKATPHSHVADIPEALKRKFAQCMGSATTIFDTVPGAQSADSPDFSKGLQNQQQVTSSVEIDPSRADINTGWNEFAGKKSAPCLRQFDQALIPAALAKQLHMGPVQVTPFEVGVGDRSVGYAMSRSAMGPAQIIEIDVDIVYVVRDRTGMEFHFFNYGPNPDRDAEKKLVQKVYNRVGNKTA